MQAQFGTARPRRAQAGARKARRGNPSAPDRRAAGSGSIAAHNHELGADVIKIEPAPKGDHTRGLGGFGAGFFAAFNRSKRSLAVDLKRPEGQAVIHRLAPTADLVLENYGPGTMERLGCGYEQLSTLNPRLVYLALKGYLAGPYEHRPALDDVVQS